MPIGEVKLINNSRAGIWNTSFSKIAEFDLGRDENIEGFSSEYIVVFGGNYARIINENGNQKATVYVDHGKYVSGVSPQGIIIEGRGSRQLYSFSGKFIKALQ